MLGVGFFELLVILGIAVFFLDKASIREIFRTLRSLHERFELLKKEWIDYLHRPIHSKSITGDDEQIYEAYEFPLDLQIEEKDAKKIEGGDSE
ncbi:hypothetical protein ACJZTR_02125 [Neorickettsia risticii]|uniref:Uncharacterized protein n=1 Tax=Neorickettsia risticii (strain Illinois) TaxID=434131 RepID=C6V501_NEORI|nr:hypothetical protein [Neorickettsia risticii]ACT69466.1 conserved hypothetical protein [Neorickettsia risticii str. Illinois]